ncbi:MAG: tetratricopeptide repeat protein [Alphaproteobacteria bacterium]
MKALSAFAAALALAVIFGVSGAAAMDSSGAKQSAHPNWAGAVEAIDLKDYQKALTLLADVRQAEPQNADAENLTGLSYRMLKNYDMAFTHYQRALQIDPKHKGAHEYLGISYLETDQLEKADALLASLKTLCAFCAERRSLDAAVKAYKRANKTS